MTVTGRVPLLLLLGVGAVVLRPATSTVLLPEILSTSTATAIASRSFTRPMSVAERRSFANGGHDLLQEALD